ncbi:MAG: DUF2812 domain-containing protein [Firmicutes bacterium]|nr:DUF2812 domain-containing protein [Bacillota bacterium]
MNRKTVHKWYWVWDFEKEERWLNEMAAQGWALESVGWCTYRFVACEPGEFTVRVEMRGPDQSYLDFLSEIGVEYVGRVFAWIYLKKPAAEGAFDLFSDIDSRRAHLCRIERSLLLIGLANLLIGVVNYDHIGWLNLLVANLLMYAYGRIRGRREQLDEERLLHE